MNKSVFNFLFVIASFIALTSCSHEEYRKEISLFVFEQNKKFKDPSRSPLADEDRKNFSKLPYFPINYDYRVEAEFIRTPNEKPFEMATTTDRLPVYVKYGIAIIEIESELIKLEVYQNIELAQKPEYVNSLFLPFTDLTNGLESYGGGRYIDLTIPEGDDIVIDFNKSYNPYCAYNSRYSCPIPPEANRIPLRIEAGVLAPINH